MVILLSSYKGHTIFAFLMSLLFFTNPLLIALTIIGGNLPDFDHKYKKDKVYQIIILGLVVFITLYILKLPYYLGLIIVFLGVTFFFSKHRSFTHSIFGVLTLAASLSLIVLLAYQLITNFSLITFTSHYYLLLIIIILLGFIFLNKRIFLIFLVLFLLSALIMGPAEITAIEIIAALFLGSLSHIILDAFTPAGIKLLAPISSKKVHKSFAIMSLIILIAFAIYLYFRHGNLIIDHISFYLSNRN